MGLGLAPDGSDCRPTLLLAAESDQTLSLLFRSFYFQQFFTMAIINVTTAIDRAMKPIFCEDLESLQR